MFKTVTKILAAWKEERQKMAEMKFTSREIYEKAISAARAYGDADQIVMLFGRTGEEILKALDYYDKYNLGRITPDQLEAECIAEMKKQQESYNKQHSQQEAKSMTRDEAVKKVYNSLHLPNYDRTKDIVNALEALGLLKFEENKPIEEKLELVRSTRPIEWASLKRDLDAMGKDIIDSHNPYAMREALKHVNYMLEELATVK